MSTLYGSFKDYHSPRYTLTVEGSIGGVKLTIIPTPEEGLLKMWLRPEDKEEFISALEAAFNES